MRKHVLSLLMVVFYGVGVAQVNDVSITVTPQIGYSWFDKKSTVENGTMYGVQAGFGFGKVMELRGIWERSWDLKQNFGKYESDIQSLFPSFNFEGRTIKVQRIGGEFKTNLPVGGFSPYLLLGTGVQTFETNLTSNGGKYKNENLYGTGGLGLKFALGDRTTFNLEGRGLVYNMNPGSLLYNPGGTSEFDEWIENTDRSTMYNWSIMAGLQFYLGGRVEDELDALDRAYLRRFSGGLSGTKVTLSPGGAYINFHGDAAYRDTYLLGGVLGIDFSNFAGLQAYYYRAAHDEKISFDFDHLEMFGADFVGKLNVPRGIVPYISVGGGYLQVRDDYQGAPDFDLSGQVTGLRNAESGYFAKGGVGVEIPLSKYVQVFGGANLLLTMQDQESEVTELRHTDQLQKHTMYNAGLRLNIGARADTDRAAERAYQRRFADERSEYDALVASLEADLKEAYAQNDAEKVMQIMTEKKTVDSLQQIDRQPRSEEGSRIRLTPQELEALIQRVLEGVNKEEELTVEERLERLESLLMSSAESTGQIVPRVGEPQRIIQSETSVSPANQALINEISQLRKELEAQNRRIQNQPTQTPQTINVVPSQTEAAPRVTTTPEVRERHLQPGWTPYIGVNFGEATTFNLGVRGFYGFANTNLMFMPEGYFAIDDGVGFGLSANGVLPFRTNDAGLTPYAGVGVGIHTLGGDLRFDTNILGGVAYQLGKGKLTADYSIRGAFRNNQVAVGYRFSF